MKFAATRLIAADIEALVSFYENVTSQKAEWLAPVFAELVTRRRRLLSAAPRRCRYSRREVLSPPPIALLSSSSRSMTWKSSSRG